MSTTISNSYRASLLTGQPGLSRLFSVAGAAWLIASRGTRRPRVVRIDGADHAAEEWRFTDISAADRNSVSTERMRLSRFCI